MDATEITTEDDYTNAEEPPSMDGLPAIGSLPAMLDSPFEFSERLPDSRGVVRVRLAPIDLPMMPSELYYVDHPEAIRRVLVDDHASYRKPDLAKRAFADLAPNGLFVAEGDQWRRIRDVVQPAFGARNVQRYADAMVTETVRRVDEWDDGEPLAIADEARAITSAILGRALFSSDFTAIADSLRSVVDAMGAKLDVPASAVPTWVPTRTNRRFKRDVREFERVAADLVRKRRQVAADERPNDLLSALIAATEDRTLSPAELRDQLFVFLFAGHETTSLALTFACFHLAANPERCERLYAEVDALDGDPSIGALDEVPTSEHIAKEALRLYPPSVEVAREPTEDVELRGYRVPKSAGMILPVYSVHRDERWWDDPESFRPERWEREDVPSHEYAYFPFGGGPRACIGNRFATLELRLVLATIARRYRFGLAPDRSADLDLRMTPTLAPAEPIELIARER
jgi:cytochrome P450